jgi:hypothetical protein
MNACIVSNNGLGDNLYMIGAVRFLLKFYNNVHFLCKNKYYENVKLFFADEPNIICVPFDETNEQVSIKSIIEKECINKNDTTDLFICGRFHKSYLKSKITNKDFLEYTIENNNDSLEYDTLTEENYSFLKEFYEDMKLNFTIFVKYFNLPSTEESIELYNSVKKYNIIFIQYKSSNNIKLNISNVLTKYLHDDKTILLCNDVNLYESVENTSEEKRNLCKKFVLNKVVNYVDTIKNSEEIYIIDSCFTGIVLPLLKQKNLKAKIVRIIRREVTDEFCL